MDTPDLDRLTILERAQLLHDATLRRHGDMLDRLEDSRLQHEDALRRHADHMAHLEILMEQQLENQTALRAIAERLAQRQDQHDEVMRHLAQTLDAIKDMLDRGNGH
jgi:hypothetical protein